MHKLRHFVAFKFNDAATAEQIDVVVAAFRELKKKISQVQSLEAGENISPEGFNDGFTHAFFITFANEEDRDTYLTHPEHEKFKAATKPFVAKGLVMDFWARE